MLVKMFASWTMASMLCQEPPAEFLVQQHLECHTINKYSLRVPPLIADMIRRRTLRTRSIKMLVLDEADEMLNKGFKEQIYDVYRYLPPATQVVLLSATLPHEILEMTSKFMTDPIRILVKRYQ